MASMSSRRVMRASRSLVLMCLVSPSLVVVVD